jgi:mRNA-degrading endonuclease RelE of RelBE toxin-antitoxin system
MYEVELSEAALTDLDDFTPAEIEEIFSFLLTLSDNPKPGGIQLIPMPEAAEGIVYVYETSTYSIIYDIVEIAGVVRVVGIFKKFSLN